MAYDAYGNWTTDAASPVTGGGSTTPTSSGGWTTGIGGYGEGVQDWSKNPSWQSWHPSYSGGPVSYTYNSAPGMNTGTNPYAIDIGKLGDLTSTANSLGLTGGASDLEQLIKNWNSFADPTQAFDWANQHYGYNGGSFAMNRIDDLWRQEYDPKYKSLSSYIGGKDNMLPQFMQMTQYANDYAGGPKDWGPQGFSQYWGNGTANSLSPSNSNVAQNTGGFAPGFGPQTNPMGVSQGPITPMGTRPQGPQGPRQPPSGLHPNPFVGPPVQNVTGGLHGGGTPLYDAQMRLAQNRRYITNPNRFRP